VVEVSEASHPKFAFFESLKTANVVKKHYWGMLSIKTSLNWEFKIRAMLNRYIYLTNHTECDIKKDRQRY
jgi:hypothetical protein